MTTSILGLLYFAALAFGTALSDSLSTAAFRAFMTTLVTIFMLGMVQ